MRFILPEYVQCKSCNLHTTRRNIVFGRGAFPAPLLFIGEAPGRSEDVLGIPFVGPSGRLLDEAIRRCKSNGIRYFITNICCCRPCDSAFGPNREPNETEALACLPRLRKTINLVQPRKIVLLGAVAKRYCKPIWKDAVCLVHPAYIIRKGGLSSPTFRLFCRELDNVFESLGGVSHETHRSDEQTRRE